MGINFIDTANIYGRGAAETFLGEALKARPRDSYILATKLYFPMTDTDYGLSAAQVEKQLDASLQRLQTDYVDLYQCHRYDSGTPLEETLEALTRAVESGKAKYIGFSEWPADKIREAIDLSAKHGFTKFVSSQPQYSLVWREPEDEVIPLSRGQRHFADRLVAARPGRADRQVRSGPAAARGHARDERGNGWLHSAADAARPASRRPATEADRRRGGAERCPSLHWPGSSANRTLRRRSSVHRGRSRSSTMPEHRARLSIRDLFRQAEAIIGEAMAQVEPA